MVVVVLMRAWKYLRSALAIAVEVTNSMYFCIHQREVVRCCGSSKGERGRNCRNC